MTRKKNPPTGHNHSNYARKIVSDLAIARIQVTQAGAAPLKPVECYISPDSHETTR